jgi:predicted sulfurtransferase
MGSYIYLCEILNPHVLDRDKGFGNLYTLKGGVSNYLKSEGCAEWVGNLFVFDDRLSLPPGKFAEEGDGGEEGGIDNGKPPSSPPRWLGRCYVCGSEVEELRHRNCASIDCNRLYLYERWFLDCIVLDV